MKVSVQNICISTMNCRPRLSLQRTSTMVSFLSGVSGTSSAGSNSMVSISSPSSKGSRALRKLFAKSSCSPKMRLKVRSARGSRYFILAIVVEFLWLHLQNGDKIQFKCGILTRDLDALRDKLVVVRSIYL